jgi:hypothetical protein
MVVIRFRLSASAGLSFSLPAEQIPYLLQALGGAAGAAGVADVADSRSNEVTLQ